MKSRERMNGRHARAHIAAESARILAEEGVRDYQRAKHKALARLGLEHERSLPSNEEIEHALREHLAIYHRDAHEQWLRLRRLAACDSMRLLSDFNPRLVGATLSGIVTAHSPVELHVTSDEPEAVIRCLDAAHIPHAIHAHRLRFGRRREHNAPMLRYSIDGIEIEIVILNEADSHEAPLCPIALKPMARASQARLEAILKESGN